MSSSSAVTYEIGVLEASPTTRRRVGRAWQLMTANRMAFVAALVLAGIGLAAILAPWIAPYDPRAMSSQNLAGPSWQHLFGTDQFGRDMLSRVLWGARLTLLAGIVGVAISAGVGVPLGLTAGYAGRTLNFIIMRAMDVLLAFPGLLLALVIVTVIGSGLTSVTVAIGVSFIPVFARLIYGATLAAKEHEYVTSAQALGCGPLRIMAVHIWPSLVADMVIVASSAIGWAILTATTLNFLGFGVHLPTPEWGADLAAGQDWLNVAWWISTFPGLAITITILASNYIGDHLAAVLDPRARAALVTGLVGRSDT